MAKLTQNYSIPQLSHFSVDVVIPVYNGENFILDALSSVYQQSFLPNKIIVVDDGSTDNTPSFVQNFKSSVPMEYVRKDNGGLSSARNIGISRCTSDYIAFLDADDIWETSKLEKQVRVVRNTKFGNLGIIYCDYSNIDKYGSFIQNFQCFKLDTQVRGKIFQELLYGNKVASSGSGVLVKRECFQKVGVFDETLPTCEDWDMWIRIALIYDFDYVNEKLVRLRRHNTNMQKDFRQMMLGELKLYGKWLNNGYLNGTFFIQELRANITRNVLYDFRKIGFYKSHTPPDLKKVLFGSPLKLFSGLTTLLTRKLNKLFKFTNL